MFRLIPSLPALYVIVRSVWPLSLPLLAKIGIALLIASQYYLWCRLSLGSVFAPEFPRPIVVLFNVVFSAIFILAVVQIGLDFVALAAMVLPGGGWVISDGWRYGAAAAATLLAAYAVAQAVRVPPLKTIEVMIKGLPSSLDGYTFLHLTDLHISRLFPASWTRAVVERSNGLDADLIVVSGDFIDGSLASWRADVEPLRALRARDGVLAVPGNQEYFFDYDA